MLYQFTSRIKELAELGHTSHFCFITVEKGYIVPPNHTNFPWGNKSPLVIVGSKGNTWAALNQPKQVYFCPFENISGSFCSFGSNFMLSFWSNEEFKHVPDGIVDTDTCFPMAMRKNGYLNEYTMHVRMQRLLQARVWFRAGINLVCHVFICWLPSFVLWCKCGQTVLT